MTKEEKLKQHWYEKGKIAGKKELLEKLWGALELHSIIHECNDYTDDAVRELERTLGGQ
jgi:hypothetical protein